MKWEAALPKAIPSTMPITPPMRQRMILSTMNCRRMARGGAPSALRTPISRVRSVTDTIMIFITPMPPTSRLMAATTPMAREICWVKLSSAAEESGGVMRTS